MNARLCWETKDRAKAWDAKEARQDAIARGIESLADQFQVAVKQQDLSLVMLPTPDFADSKGGTPELSALDLIRDMLADTAGDVLLQQMVQHLAAAARGEPVQMQCAMFLARMGGIYAERHAAAHVLGEEA